MRQEEIFEILSKIHNNPASWLPNLFHFSGHQLSMFACGCEVLLMHGVTAAKLRKMIEQSEHFVGFLVDGQYDKALWIAKASEAESIGVDPDAIRKVSPGWTDTGTDQVHPIRTFD